MAKSEIKIVRLTTGEEIICEAKETFEGETRTGVNVVKPLLVVPTSTSTLTMIPWMYYVDHPKDGLFIPDKIVAFVVNPQKPMKAEYEKAFSKILTPASGDVIAGADMNKLGSKLRLSTD